MICWRDCGSSSEGRDPAHCERIPSLDPNEHTMTTSTTTTTTTTTRSAATRQRLRDYMIISATTTRLCDDTILTPTRTRQRPSDNQATTFRRFCRNERPNPLYRTQYCLLLLLMLVSGSSSTPSRHRHLNHMSDDDQQTAPAQGVRYSLENESASNTARETFRSLKASNEGTIIGKWEPSKGKGVIHMGPHSFPIPTGDKIVIPGTPLREVDQSITPDQSIIRERTKEKEQRIIGRGREKLNSIHYPYIHSIDVTRRKHKKPGGRRKILGGRKQVLQILNDDQIRSRQHCEGVKFKQRVKQPGCLTKTVVNRFCHGACSSFFIPRLNAKRLKADFKSCAMCRPKEYEKINVTLDCPGQDPPNFTKTVIKVNSCACMNVRFAEPLY